MENKYYTPSLEEFHIGFEFEYLDEDDNTWNKTTISNQSQLCNWTGFEIQKRVAYLSQSDIESFGFKHLGSRWFEIDSCGKLGHWLTVKLRKWHDNEVYIIGHRGSEEESLFSGDIKNKSELNKILKMINVIE